MDWLRRQLKESDSLFDGTLIAAGIGIGIIFGIVIHVYFTPVVETVHAEEQAVIEPVEVILEVTYTKEDIIRRIEAAFPEDAKTAVKIAKCESGLRPVIQSQHTLSYGQEKSYGLFQIHAPDWHHVALHLGYTEYRTSVEENIKMARYIYELAGKKWTPWSCYTKGMI
jgi:hypothetical protein